MESPLLPPIHIFNSWKAFTAFLSENNIGNAFSGVGIFHNKKGNTLLRSVDNTPFYKDEDNLYTLFGQVGDQDLNDRYNAPLLAKGKAYLYRVKGKAAKHYIYYGEVQICEDSLQELIHHDREGNPRKIYRVALKA